MGKRRLHYTEHAEDMLVERRIKRDWVKGTIARPDAVEPDPRRPGITLAFRKIAEQEGRILRVAYGRRAL
jgi:Domain of unknown function (DUF4258)